MVSKMSLTLVRDTGKPLRWVLITHSHPDHIGNLDLFRLAGEVQVVAHARSPVRPDLLVSEEMPLARRVGARGDPDAGALGSR